MDVRMPPIRRGYPYGLTFRFPEGYLADGETLRAELRKTPAQVVPIATFAVSREGREVALSLENTNALPLGIHKADLTLVLANGEEAPIDDVRLVIAVEEHITRASA